MEKKSETDPTNIPIIDLTKEELEEQYSTLVIQYSKLQRELENKSQQNHDYKRELTRLTTLEAEYLSEIESLQSAEKKECDRLKLKIQNLEEEKTEANNRNNALSEQIEQLELSIFKKDEEIIKLQEEFKSISDNLNSSDNKNELEELQLQNIDLKQQISEFDEKLAETIAYYKKQQVENEERIYSVQEDLQKLNENYECKKEELDEAKVLIETLQEDLMLTKSELEASKTKPLQDGSQGNSLFAEVDDRRLELQDRMALMKSQYLEMKQERSKLLSQIASLNSRNAMLCQRWDSEIKNRTDDDDKLEQAYRARIDVLESELSACREEISVRQKILAKNLDSGEVEFMENMLDAKNKDIIKLRKEIDDFSLTRMALSRQLRDCNREMMNWRAKATKSESVFGKLQAEMEELKLSKTSETIAGNQRISTICMRCSQSKKSQSYSTLSQPKLKDVVENLCRISDVGIYDDRFRTVDCSRQIKRSLLRESESNFRSDCDISEGGKENIVSVKKSQLEYDNGVKKVQFTEETVDNSNKKNGKLKKTGRIIHCKPIVLKKKV